jgi:hypothetical protein
MQAKSASLTSPSQVTTTNTINSKDSSVDDDNDTKYTKLLQQLRAWKAKATQKTNMV